MRLEVAERKAAAEKCWLLAKKECLLWANQLAILEKEAALTKEKKPREQNENGRK